MQDTTVRIYGCGGCGTEMTQRHSSIPSIVGFPNVKRCVVDTSDSNLLSDSGIEHFFIPGLSGAGKNQEYAREKIAPYSDKIMTLFPPERFNIVVSSTSGGSGPEICKMIVEQLIKKNAPFAVVLVGELVDALQTKNTMATLRGLLNLSVRTETPVPFMFYLNESNEDLNAPEGLVIASQDVVNTHVGNAIRSIALLASEQHNRLDHRDVRNYFRYNSVLEVNPSLAEIVITSAMEKAEEYNGKAISVISLLTDGDNVRPAIGQLSDAHGVYCDELRNSDHALKDYYYVLTSANVRNILTYVKSADELFLKKSQGFVDNLDEFM